MTTINSINLKENHVNHLVDNIKKSKTLMIVSVKGLPSKQFQDIKKSLRDNALVKIMKNNILLRAFKKYEKNSILSLEKYITSDIAIVLSQMDGYELAGLLNKKRTRVYAKTGQITESDIEVKEGPTDLVPGPAISELGALGIQISVEGGKIAIKSSKVIVKKGEIIKENVSSVLQKLKIQPFFVGLNPLIIYDINNEKIYDYIDINPKKYSEELITSSLMALGFAQKIEYYCKETVKNFIIKAKLEADLLNKLIK